jgi:hypothetical protein
MEKELFENIEKLKNLIEKINLPQTEMAALLLGLSIQTRILFYKLLGIKKVKIDNLPTPSEREIKSFF